MSEETGDVYVADRGNNRIQEFDSTGTTVLAEFDGAAAPTGPLSAPSDIAIDNSGSLLDPSSSDLYVSGVAEGAQVIYKFSSSGTYLGQITAGEGGVAFGELFGLAVDSSGELWVFQASKEIDNYSDALENEFLKAREDPREGTAPGLAVDTEDNLYLGTGSTIFVKLDSTGAKLIERVGSESTSAGAVDFETNEIYVDNLTSVGRFSSSAAFVERFGEGSLSEGSGIAINWGSAEKLVYVADQTADAVRIFRGVLRPTVITQAPSEAGPTKATLNASVNPEGLPVSSCSFEYGTSTTYEHSVACEPSPGSGNAPVAVATKLTALQPDTTYHYRVLASNENGPSAGADELFTTSGPGLHGEGVTDVSADSATFDASINPHGALTSVYFQYGTSSTYGATIPEPPGISLGAGEGDVEVPPPQHVQGLSASTTYHYRVVAVSGGEEFPGPDQSFTTQGPGGELALPDARAYELVSPADKHGGVIEGISSVGIVQAAFGGGALSYLANAPTEAEAQGDAGLVQVLSTRGAGGWSSKDIATAHQSATGIGVGLAPEYRFFSEDLSAGLLQPYGRFNPQMAPGEGSEQTPYLHRLAGCTGSCFRPLVSARAGHENVPLGTQFGEELPCEEENGVKEIIEPICGPLVIGATSDLSHAVLISPAPLSPGVGREQLYEWSSDGSLQLLSVLPVNTEGKELPAPEGSARLGAGFGVEGESAVISAKRAISSDGTRIFWEAQSALYMRDSEKHKTFQLDSAEAACLKEVASKCASGGARFQIASADGSRVLFSDTQRLSKDSGEGDLYECGISEAGCELTDLTPESAGQSARVQGGVLGASEEDTTVYFVAKGTLGTGANARGERASAGQANLYVRRGGETSFITTLSEEDFANWSEGAEHQPARVSPNGQWLSFMSARPLTGYDNRDAASGQPDAEIYLYDASTRRLSCASCDPSGARPIGVEYHRIRTADSEQLVSGQAEWGETSWVAALAPESVSFSRGESAYQSRYLSDDGRLFFNDLDPLVPQDVNNNWDVYEHEPSGLGSCSSTATGFSELSEGCTGLISSGSSPQESAFLDASGSGGDVFFLTSASLTPQDFDATRDVYDAHECTSASPCIPTAAVPPPPCVTEASCKASPTPQPQIFGAPSSATFSGAGNPSPPQPGKPKKPTRHELLLKALKSCHKRYPRSKAHRGSCEREAQRKYGTKKASAKKAAKTKKSAKGGQR